MKTDKLLLCTDMDRTIIPNGRVPEHPEARKRFREFCALPQVKLAYVSGRHLHLVEQAIAEYALPRPDVAVTDVGTKIYRSQPDGWEDITLWQKRIARSWRGKTHDRLRQALLPCRELQLQESSKQNAYKLSYYLSLDVGRERVLSCVRQHLDGLGVAAELIWSVDDMKRIGLLDILPRNAGKRDAIEFLQQLLGYSSRQTLFAGDSGNDLTVLASPIPAVLVANAEPEVRQQAMEQATANGCDKSLYLARSDKSALGGYYAAGVLQGVAFFFPDMF